MRKLKGDVWIFIRGSFAVFVTILLKQLNKQKARCKYKNLINGLNVDIFQIPLVLRSLVEYEVIPPKIFGINHFKTFKIVKDA